MRDYYAAVGASLEDFVITFIQRIDDLPTTGWPFSATKEFGSLLAIIYFSVSEPEIKRLCLKRIWDLAYVSDQWACQPIMKNILNEKVSADVETEFAIHIQDSKVKLSKNDFEGLKLSPSIKKAIFDKLITKR